MPFITQIGHNRMQEGQTALVKATINGHLKVARLLLKRGANKDHQYEVICRKGWWCFFLFFSFLVPHFQCVRMQKILFDQVISNIIVCTSCAVSFNQFFNVWIMICRWGFGCSYSYCMVEISARVLLEVYVSFHNVSLGFAFTHTARNFASLF